jgi:hypothetical protein
LILCRIPLDALDPGTVAAMVHDSCPWLFVLLAIVAGRLVAQTDRAGGNDRAYRIQVVIVRRWQ